MKPSILITSILVHLVSTLPIKYLSAPSIEETSPVISFFQENDDIEAYSTGQLNAAFHNFFSSENLFNAFKQEDVITSHDENGNLIIDISNQFSWVKKLTRGIFDFSKQDEEKLFEKLYKRLEEFDYSIFNVDNSTEGEQLSVYAQTVFSKPKCSEIDESEFSGICEINPFKHKIINKELHERPHLIRGILVPNVGISIVAVMELLNMQYCSQKKVPRLQAIIYNPICISIGFMRTTSRHMAIALLINGIQDVTGLPFAEQIPGIQLVLGFFNQEYRGYDCVDVNDVHTPIHRFTDNIELQYIQGITVDPYDDGDSLHSFEFAMFPGTTNGDLGYAEINRRARWKYDAIREDNYRFSYKHVGNLDRELLNYHLRVFSIHELYSIAFRSLRTETYKVLKDVTKGYAFKALDIEDDERHPILAPISRLTVNQGIHLFVFNDKVHTVEHAEPMSLNFEYPY